MNPVKPVWFNKGIIIFIKNFFKGGLRGEGEGSGTNLGSE